MTTKPERYSALAQETLSERNYFSSLVEASCRHGLLEEQDVERLQNELAELLATQIRRYNNGDSSSIRSEIAGELTESIFFTLGVYYKSLPLADAAEEMKNRALQYAFTVGQKQILKKVGVCRLTHHTLVKRLFETPNEFYRSTVVDGINGFFKSYRPEFTAHSIGITADYPTMCGEKDRCGIEFIEQYLHNLFFENEFLCMLNKDAVHAQLKRYNPAFSGVPMNLCEPIFNAALACAMTDRDIDELSVSRAACEELYDSLGEKTSDELHLLLSHACGTVCDQLDCSERLREFLNGAVSIVLPSWENALRCGALKNLLGVK